MDKILDTITSGNLDVLTAALVLAVFALFHIDKIASFIDSRRKIKIKNIEDAIACQHISGEVKDHLVDLIEKEHFRSVTGISLDKEVRHAFIKAHKDAQGELKFAHFKRAIPYLNYRNSELSVKTNGFSFIGAFVQFLIGLFFLAIGIAFIIVVLITLPSTITEVLKLFTLSLFSLGFGFTMLVTCLPYVSAIHLTSMLATIKERQNTKESNTGLPPEAPQDLRHTKNTSTLPEPY